jgi:hypothetical protein
MSVSKLVATMVDDLAALMAELTVVWRVEKLVAVMDV